MRTVVDRDPSNGSIVAFQQLAIKRGSELVGHRNWGQSHNASIISTICVTKKFESLRMLES